MDTQEKVEAFKHHLTQYSYDGRLFRAFNELRSENGELQSKNKVELIFVDDCNMIIYFDENFQMHFEITSKLYYLHIIQKRTDEGLKIFVNNQQTDLNDIITSLISKDRFI